MDNIFEVHNKNAYVGEEIEITEGLVVRLIYLDRRPWIQTALIIQENTKIKDIEVHFSAIRKSHRDTIGNIFGSNLQLKDLDTIYDLYLLSEQGIKPAELAKRINYDFLAVVHTVIGRETGEVNRTDQGWFFYQWILEDLRMGWDASDYDDALLYQYQGIQEGTIRFNHQSYPVDSEKINNRLKTFKIGLDEGRIFLPKERLVSRIDRLEAYLYLIGSYKETNITIKKYDKAYWKKHKGWIEQRLDSISEMIETSSNILITKMRDRY